MNRDRFNKIIEELEIELINERYQKLINESKSIVKKIDHCRSLLTDYKDILNYLDIALKDYKKDHEGVSLFFYKTKKYKLFYFTVLCGISKMYKFNLNNHIFQLVDEMRTITCNFSDTYFYDRWVEKIKFVENKQEFIGDS